MMVEPRSEHLVNVALRLFYTNGFHATGIDGILDEAGVAKMTLYKHFRSKDQLILAALKKRDEMFLEWLYRCDGTGGRVSESENARDVRCVG